MYLKDILRAWRCITIWFFQPQQTLVCSSGGTSDQKVLASLTQLWSGSVAAAFILCSGQTLAQAASSSSLRGLFNSSLSGTFPSLLPQYSSRWRGDSDTTVFCHQPVTEPVSELERNCAVLLPGLDRPARATRARYTQTVYSGVLWHKTPSCPLRCQCPLTPHCPQMSWCVSVLLMLSRVVASLVTPECLPSCPAPRGHVLTVWVSSSDWAWLSLAASTEPGARVTRVTATAACVACARPGLATAANMERESWRGELYTTMSL